MIPAFPAVNAREAQKFLRAEYAAAELTDYQSIRDLPLVQQTSAVRTSAAISDSLGGALRRSSLSLVRSQGT